MAFGLQNAPFEVTGIAAVDRKLSKFPDKLQKKMITKSLRKAAKLIQSSAVGRVAADSGNLKRSIKVKSKKRSRKNAHIVGIRVLTNWKTYKGDFNPAAFVEFGTQYQAAAPFMRPAGEGSRAQVVAFFRQDLAATIKEMAIK